MRRLKKDVAEAILETKEELAPLLNRLDFAKISKYNHGYMRYAQYPTKFFIDAEVGTYQRTLNYIYSRASAANRILDIGFFIPIIPIALAKLGFSVSAIEKLIYYDKALDEIISFARKKYAIEVLDSDVIEDNLSDLEHQFDMVILQAVLEHLNGTPKYVLNRARQFVKPAGTILVEVPNAARLRKRLVFLMKGKVPFAPFYDYYHSAYPFAGHNREYTIDDLKYALDQSGLDLVRLDVYQKSPVKPQPLWDRVIYWLELLGPASWKGSIWVIAKPREVPVTP